MLIDCGFHVFFLVQPASNTVPMTVDYRLSKMLSSSSLTGGLEHDFYDFPFSWEFHHPNCYSLHHFSEGLVETTNQIINQIINHH